MHKGLIDAALIQREVPDYKERVFYISGPRAMVVRFRRILKELGVARSRIKEDFFPGFAGNPAPAAELPGRTGGAAAIGRDPAVSYFLRPFRNIRPSRKALSVQSPFGRGGETDCLNCLICLTPRPNRNRASVQAPSEVCGSRFSSRIFSARALARSFSVAAGSRRTAAIARSFRRMASADGASWLTGTGEFPRIE